MNYRALALIAGLLLNSLRPAAAQTAGNLDPLNASVVGVAVRSTGVQSDGRIILAGSFTTVMGAAR